MNCRKIETHLIAYLEGRASAADRRAVEEHLASCAACHTRAEEFQRLWGVLEEVPSIEPSPAFDAALHQRIAALPRRNWLAWISPSPRLALAAVFLIALSVWISNRPPAVAPPVSPLTKSEEDFQAIKDLQVLENYDVLANFDALSELPPAAPAQKPDQTQSQDQ